MIDDQNETMTNVGHVSNPAAIRIRLADGQAGKIEGNAETTFLPADGRAVFEDIVVTGTNKYVKFTFEMVDLMTYGNVSTTFTPEIEIMERQDSNSTCEVVEGLVYFLIKNIFKIRNFFIIDFMILKSLMKVHSMILMKCGVKAALASVHYLV